MKKILLFIFLCASCQSMHQTPTSIADREVARFARRYPKDYGFNIVGTGGRTAYSIQRVSIHFEGYQQVTVDEARCQLIHLYMAFMKQASKNPRFIAACKGGIFDYNNVHIDIVYGPKDSLFFTPPFVASAYIAKERVYYRQYDPYQRKLGDLYDESVEEAFEKVYGPGVLDTLRFSAADCTQPCQG